MAHATVTLRGKHAHEQITLTREQAIYLLDLLSDPNEIAQAAAYLSRALGTKAAKAIAPPVPAAPKVAPTLVPQAIEPPTLPPLNTLPLDERLEAIRVHAEQMAAFKASQQTPAPVATPAPVVKPVATPAPAPAVKPKAVRKPRKPKTAPTVVLVNTLAPIVGISALPGTPLPSPTATCAVASPSPTPSVKSGTGADKIVAAKAERDMVNDRGTTELLQRAKELGVTGAIHKMKDETLRVRIAIAEAKLATKPVAAPITPAAKTAPKATKRTVVADFVNTLPDGRKLYTIVYSDGAIENEIGKAVQAA